MKKCFTNQSCLPDYQALFTFNNQLQKHSPYVEMIGDSEIKVCISYDKRYKQVTTKLKNVVLLYGALYNFKKKTILQKLYIKKSAITLFSNFLNFCTNQFWCYTYFSCL